jgi:hypothetical protein
VIAPAAIVLVAAALLQPPAAEPDYGEIVVTGSRRPLQPLEEPIAYFRRHCFEPLRRHKQAAMPPEAGSDWELLPDASAAACASRIPPSRLSGCATRSAAMP